jgi:iron(III) transport system ATP-binding protein
MSEAASTPAVALRGLTKRFDAVLAVDRAELEVEPGTICALVGPSGCGKTTLLRLVAGFERPDAGRVEVAGEVVADERMVVAPEKRRIGMVFQDYALFPHRDVAGNVGYGLPRRGRAERVADVLSLVGLEDARSRPIHELSGGQQQRVALARALAPRPEVILLDEPFSNLDASLRDRLRREMREILVRAGVTAVFVTHDQEEALSIADAVAVMNGGRIEQSGTPEAVYSRPANAWVADFLGETDVFDGEASGGLVSCELATLRTDAGFEGPARVLVRPEAIALAIGGAAPDEAKRAEVIERRFYGHDQLLDLRLESGTVVRSRRPGFPAWHPGDTVWAWIEGRVVVLPRER